MMDMMRSKSTTQGNTFIKRSVSTHQGKKSSLKQTTRITKGSTIQTTQPSLYQPKTKRTKRLWRFRNTTATRVSVERVSQPHPPKHQRRKIALLGVTTNAMSTNGTKLSTRRRRPGRHS